MVYFPTSPKQRFFSTLQNRRTQKLRTCSTFTKSVMVLVAVLKMCVAWLFFMNLG